MKRKLKKVKKTIYKYRYYIISLIIFLVLFTINFSLYLFKPYEVDKDFSKIDISNAKNLMIVAHPDDETLWGGAHLIEDDYLVVCITCGPIKERVNEFISVMEATEDKYILLGYPDKTNGSRDNWKNCKDDLTKDLDKIINLKDWNVIVTHNPEGEYGHLHHKLTNSIVTDLVSTKDKLYYFGRYHSKNTFANFYDEMSPISETTYKKKVHVLGLYRSQKFIQTMFNHMYEYEDWVSYEEWGGNENETDK